MHSSRVISSMCLMLILWFSSCLVSQASSRVCYVCESTTNETCFTDVERGAFKMDCVKSITEVLKKTDDESTEHLRALIKGYAGGYSPESITDFECVTFVGVVYDVNINIRVNKTVKACVPRSKDCENLKDPLRVSGFLSDTCDRCNTNLCNTLNPHVIQEEIPAQPTHYENAENHAKAMKSEFLRIGFLSTLAFLVTTLLRL